MIDAETVAANLDAAHDYILVHGWGQQALVNRLGHVCAVGAVHYMMRDRGWTNRIERVAMLDALTMALAGQGVRYQHCHDKLTRWNDEPQRTIDEVLELFRSTAKALRNGDIVLGEIKPMSGTTRYIDRLLTSVA